MMKRNNDLQKGMRLMNENTIRFDSEVATLTEISINQLEEASYYNNDISYDDDSGEWIAADKDTFDYWVDLDKALLEATEAWNKLDNMQYRNSYKESYNTLGSYAKENGFDDYYCDVQVCLALANDIEGEIKKIVNDAECGEIIRHIEKMFPNDFDYLNADVIKGKNGYYLKGEGGARSVFAKQVDNHTYVSGSGLLCIEVTEWA